VNLAHPGEATAPRRRISLTQRDNGFARDCHGQAKPLPAGPVQVPPPGFILKAQQAQILAAALTGIELGAWDQRILDWMSNWDASTVLTVASWITRTRDTSQDHSNDDQRAAQPHRPGTAHQHDTPRADHPDRPAARPVAHYWKAPSEGGEQGNRAKRRPLRGLRRQASGNPGFTVRIRRNPHTITKEVVETARESLVIGSL
jgi:hypothetical protein